MEESYIVRPKGDINIKMFDKKNNTPKVIVIIPDTTKVESSSL